MNFFKMTAAAIYATFLLSFVSCETTTPVELEKEIQEIDGQTYIDRLLDFSITAPSGWDVKLAGDALRETESIVRVVMVSPEKSADNFSPTANIVYEEIGSETDCAPLTTVATGQFQNDTNWHLSELLADDRFVWIDSADAIKGCRYGFVGTYSGPEAPKNSLGETIELDLRTEMRYWIYQGNLILLTLLAPTEMYDDTWDGFMEIIGSIDVRLGEDDIR